MISVDYEQVVYAGNGSQDAWPYSFPIYDGDVIRLILIDTDGTEINIEQDYFVDVPGSTVYYPGYAPGEEPPVADQPPKVQTGQKLIVYRDTEITQDGDLGDSWPFDVIEKGLDKLTMILQEKAFALARCLKISQGQAAEIDNYDPTVPLAADKVICGNAAGDGFEAREALMEVNGAWDGEGRQIHSVADPTGDQDAATKNYVDTLTDNNFMKLQPDGTAWEGRNLPISNVAGPALVRDAANKDYVDRILAGYSGQGDRFVFFDNVAQMQAADLVPSQMAVTLGYHDVNDGGAGVYTIRDIGADTPDGGSIIEITGTSYVAELITDGVVNVKQFGAVGDGITDASVAIQNCLDYCATNKKKAVAVGTFKVENTISFLCSCDFSTAIFQADGSAISPVVEVGSLDDPAYSLKIKLPVVENVETRSEWGSGTGILVLMATSCEITIPDVLYFNVGVQLSGGKGGCQTNTFFIRQLSTNKINLLFKPTTSTGWANSNTFIGGRFGFYGASGYIATGSRNIVMEQYDTDTPAGGTPNNNVFYNLDVESGDAIPEYCMEIDGAYNQFNNLRYEGPKSKQILLNARAGTYVQGNIWFGGYQSNQLTLNCTGAGSIIKNLILTGQDNHRLFGALNILNSTDGTAIFGYDQNNVSATELYENTESGKYSMRLACLGLTFKDYNSTGAKVSLNLSNGLQFFDSNDNTKYFGFRRYQAGDFRLYDTDTDQSRNQFIPSVDDTINFGASSSRWKEIFCTNGTINTSDERDKQDIEPIPEAVFCAWAKVNFVQYRFKNAVSEKGENARIHFGLIAQRVREAFESEGLDAFEYGLLCYDEWEDEYEDVENEGGTVEHKQITKAGNRYGLRYDEALALECAYQRWITNKLEARLDALEEVVRI